MSEKILYVHCGYPKTATTTLQKWVYPNVPAIKYLGRTFSVQKKFCAEVEMLSGMRYQYAHDKPEIIQQSITSMNKFLVSDGVPFVSDEGFLAQCLVPKFGLKKTKELLAPSLRNSLEHIQMIAKKAGFDKIKPVVTLRKQSDLVGSFYAEAFDRYSRSSEVNTFEKFVDELLSKSGCVNSDVVDYCALEDQLVSIFGKGNYQFLMFDWIEQSPELFSKVLGNFIGIDASSIHDSLAQSAPENVRRSQGAKTQLKIRRKNARYYLDGTKKLLLPNVNLGLGRHLGSVLAKFEYGPAVLEPSEEALSRIRNFYHSSNQEFVKRHPEFSALLDV